MRYILKPHARMRMRERKITESIIKDALDNPTKIEYDTRGRVLFKKLYQRNGKERLLFMVGEGRGDLIEIITIIDTTKVKKYL